MLKKMSFIMFLLILAGCNYSQPDISGIWYRFDKKDYIYYEFHFSQNQLTLFNSGTGGEGFFSHYEFESKRMLNVYNDDSLLVNQIEICNYIKDSILEIRYYGRTEKYFYLSCLPDSNIFNTNSQFYIERIRDDFDDRTFDIIQQSPAGASL